MAKENVVRFFEQLATDKAMTEKLAAADKDYAEKHEVKAGDEAARKAAVEAILVPLAKEAGFPFTVDELAAYEKEQQGKLKGKLAYDEMENVAGGVEDPSLWEECDGRGKRGIPSNPERCIFLGSNK